MKDLREILWFNESILSYEESLKRELAVVARLLGLMVEVEGSLETARSRASR